MTTDRSRDYVTVLSCLAGDDWLPEATAQISSWLREKQFDVSLAEDVDADRPGANLSVRTMVDERVGDLKVTLIERSNDGVWKTEIVAHDEVGERDWVSVRVTNSLGRFVAVPRVARYLMQALPLRDGLLEMEATCRVVGVESVEELITALTDYERHGLAFVAGSDSDSQIPFDVWAKQVANWSREVHGLAKVFVLDPVATRDFAARVGSRHAADPWVIRTYHPGVDFDNPADSRRHRFLTTQSLARLSDGAIKYLLGDIARQQAANRPPDLALQRVQRRFDRLENRLLVEQVTAVEEVAKDLGPAAPEPTEVSKPAGLPKPEESQQLSLVKKILGLTHITEKALTELVARLARRDQEKRALANLQERIDRLQSNVEGLQDQNRELIDALDEAQLETEIARLDLDAAHDKTRWLSSRLKQTGDYEAEWLPVPDEFVEERPSSFGELLNRIDDLVGLQFTGDVKEVLQLDAVDTNGAALRVAWDAVLLMTDYVRARAAGDFTQGLDQFIASTPPGYREFPAGKFAETETRATMKSFGKERVFPVPSSIHPEGEVVMKAHFKLARIGTVSPRMHIYDAHPAAPLVCIGYIGSHLTNTQT